MPTPRKNLDELKESGTYQKNVGRYRGRAAAVEGFKPLGAPPAHLGKLEAAAWRELEGKAAPGTLAAGDFVLVELAARLTVKMQTSTEFSPTEGRLLQSVMKDLGMSPTTRGKVTPAKDPKQPSRFADLMQNLGVKPN